MKNTSGGVLNKGLVKPHASGGVTSASSRTDGPPIGGLLVDGVADAALGQAELFID